MAKGSVKLSILSTYDNKGEKQAERAMTNFAKRFGTMNEATGKWELDGPTSRLAEMSIKADQMAASWQRASDKIVSVGDTITKYVSGPAAIIAGASVKLASDFETSMAKVATIMDGSMSSDAMGEAILQLSTDSGRAATELAEAAYQAQSAGVATQDTVAFLEQAVNLSKAGFTDTTTAVDTLTTILNAYGMSAEEVTSISDKLIQTQNAGKTTVGELAASMGTVIPTAAAYGVNLDNLSTAYVTLTKQGINTANATTYISGMLTELADDGSNVSRILQEQTGKSFNELMADGASLGDVIGILSDSVDGDSTAFANLWGNVRAGRGALAIANAGVDEFNAQLDGMENASGNTEDALGKLQTSSAKLNKAINALKNTGIELGQQFLEAAAPLLDELVSKTKQAVTWFSNLDDRTKRNIARFIAFSAALGPAVTLVGKVVGVGAKAIGTFGKISASLAKASAGGSKFAQALGNMNMSAGKMAGVGIAAAAIGALVAIIADYVAHEMAFSNANKKMSDAMSKLRDPASNAASSIETLGTKAMTVTGNLRDMKDAHVDMINGWGAESERVSESAALLEYYTGIIESHAGQVDGNAQRQAELTTAVEGYNSIMGTAIEVTDLQTGTLSAETEEIRKNADEYIAAQKKKAAAEAYGEAWIEQQQAIKEYGDTLSYITTLEEQYNASTDPAERAALREEIETQTGVLQDLGRIVNDDTEALEGYSQIMAEADGITYDATATMQGFLTQNGTEQWSNMGINVVDFAQKLEDLGITTQDLANLTPEQLQQMATAYQSGTGTMLATMDSFGGDLAAKAQAAGYNATTATASGMTTGQTTLTTTGQTIVTGVMDAVGSYEGDWQVIGGRFVQGLADGMTLNAWYAKAAAAATAAAAAQAARDELGIASPSKVMMEIGGYASEGLALGYESKLAQVAGISGKYADAMRFDPYTMQNGYDVGALRDGIAPRGGSIVNYNLSINGVEINSRPEMREAFIEFMSTLNRLGVM